MYLHREDLKALQEFLDTFPDANVVEVDADSSSGIGSIITATIHAVDVRGVKVNVSKVIADETSW
jgi:hypothetical protein